MRKQIVSHLQRESPSANATWLDLEALARVEVTSEDAAHPIESALLTVGATGWRAENAGEQTVLSSSKRRRGSDASACSFERRRRRVRKSSSCAGRQRRKVHGAISC